MQSPDRMVIDFAHVLRVLPANRPISARAFLGPLYTAPSLHFEKIKAIQRLARLVVPRPHRLTHNNNNPSCNQENSVDCALLFLSQGFRHVILTQIMAPTPTSQMEVHGPWDWDHGKQPPKATEVAFLFCRPFFTGQSRKFPHLQSLYIPLLDIGRHTAR